MRFCNLTSVFAISAACLAGAPALSQQVLDVGVASNVNTFDPARTKIGEEYIIDFLVYSGLTEIDGQGGVFPDLAEDWSASEDQTVWTFTLREGVTFHDGSAFEPEDVKATFERIMDEAVGSTIRVNFSIVDEITIDDPRTVTFHLSQPYSGFPELLGDRQARIVPRDKVDMLASEPIGTGPFKFVSYTPGDNIALEKFDSYYKQGQPQLDEVNLRIMPESAAKISAIETGELDLIWSVPMEAVEGLGENEDVRIDSIATSTWDGLIMNASEPPFDDPRVRKAVLMSLDKQALVEFALFGNGTPTHSMIPPTHPYFNDEIAISGPDVEGARALLAEAGYEDGFDITLYLPVGRPTRERLGVAAQQYLAEIGINAELQRVPWDQFIKEIEGKAAFFADGFYSRPTIDASIYPWFHSEGSWNTQLWHYSNEEIDTVLDAARAATSEEERTQLYKEFQALANETPAGAIAYVQDHMNAVRTEVDGFSSSAMLWLDLREVSISE